MDFMLFTQFNTTCKIIVSQELYGILVFLPNSKQLTINTLDKGIFLYYSTYITLHNYINL